MNCDSICMHCAPFWHGFASKANMLSIPKLKLNLPSMAGLLAVEKHLPEACNRKMLQIYEIYARRASKQAFFSTNKCEKRKLKLLMNESHLAFKFPWKAGDEGGGPKHFSTQCIRVQLSPQSGNESWSIACCVLIGSHCGDLSADKPGFFMFRSRLRDGILDALAPHITREPSLAFAAC